MLYNFKEEVEKTSPEIVIMSLLEEEKEFQEERNIYDGR
jgi:hypothetical protein